MFADIKSSDITLPGPLFLAQPGAGLTNQDSFKDDTDFIFDTIFSNNFETTDVNDSGYGSPEVPKKIPEPEKSRSMARIYACDQDLLNAYYKYIHPYFPVLPPKVEGQISSPSKSSEASFQNGSQDSMPSSPLALAISATLALIPHPNDPNPESMESVLQRRSQAQSFAVSALESLETESELLYSTTKPSEALSQGPSLLPRPPFHPQCRVENESVVALLILGTYEYAQRGNISKLRTRAGQALVAAMGLELHSRSEESGPYSEGDRRAWWMTYILVCQGSILSNTSLTIYLYDPRFTTPKPTFEADPASWDTFLQAQQVIVTATQFVLDLEIALKKGSNFSTIGDRMLELEALLDPLCNEANQWTLDASVKLTSGELAVSQALRGMAKIKLNSARIKLHRYCAFSDMPVFTQKHCDLKASSDGIPERGVDPRYGVLPFNSHFSAKLCMKSAFNIAHAFRSLPSPVSDELVEAPRMVPIFACCAMQSSYAMVMLSYRTRAMGFGGALDGASPAKVLLRQLGDGLRLVLNALRNYSIAYEALGGMKDQILVAADSVDIMQYGMVDELPQLDGCCESMSVSVKSQM
ncbi:hypothetical protein BP5796_09441 [Coleophoma crateriformis]|uniref:Transcription factor domain-containing protein n=1 Tax=Coleophoma crateriformis TaxID=565419 RepID=A0A3D8QY11_9HELO|nr:hypothetical protein BP5796_09441 [Coleophoma crateriformis]